MDLTPLVAVHMSSALTATLIGPVAIWARRARQQRPRLHRAFGYAWITLMLVAAVSAIFIRDYSYPNIYGFNLIHLLIPVTLFGIYGALFYIYRGNVRMHSLIMQWLYAGACITAGLFTLLPSRYLGKLLWG
ncbi:DUF2306 domain-containing protein [Roseateles sp. NT4]|uniref:DUF2306 domain-containing protein n=1 Tax=Roseateles sp. NT4 TaxID=3453715 RepID=UPI003EE9D822